MLLGGLHCVDSAVVTDRFTSFPYFYKIIIPSLGIHPPYHGEYLGYNDGFFGNECVFRESYQSDCDAVAGWTVHNNSVASANGHVRVCGMNFSAWQAQGHDSGTVVRRWPTDTELVALGEAVLKMGG